MAGTPVDNERSAEEATRLALRLALRPGWEVTGAARAIASRVGGRAEPLERALARVRLGWYERPGVVGERATAALAAALSLVPGRPGDERSEGASAAAGSSG